MHSTATISKRLQRIKCSVCGVPRPRKPKDEERGEFAYHLMDGTTIHHDDTEFKPWVDDQGFTHSPSFPKRAIQDSRIIWFCASHWEGVENGS